MSSIGRYIVRTTLGAFLMVAISLTAVIWVTHALRDIDIVTNQGQTILVFIGITGLLIPALLLVIAPLALMIATAYTLNKLNTDSEIIVMNAAGMSPWRIFMPFFAVGLIVSALVGLISAYVAPKCLREMRTMLTRISADVITNIVQPGRFTSLEGGRLTFNIRERRPNGELLGIFIDDRRDANERVTFFAERGQTIENEFGSFLILENGNVQRLQAKERDPAIIEFQRNPFDLTKFTGGSWTPTFNATERFIWDLVSPDPKDPYVQANEGRLRAELHDRLLAPVYPLVFTIIAFAVLGAPRTTRQSRGSSMFMAIATVTAVRLVGFACIVSAAKQPGALVILYVVIAAAVVINLMLISRGAIVEPPAFLLSGISALQARLVRRRAAPVPA